MQEAIDCRSRQHLDAKDIAPASETRIARQDRARVFTDAARAAGTRAWHQLPWSGDTGPSIRMRLAKTSGRSRIASRPPTWASSSDRGDLRSGPKHAAAALADALADATHRIFSGTR